LKEKNEKEMLEAKRQKYLIIIFYLLIKNIRYISVTSILDDEEEREDIETINVNFFFCLS
jgi:hypothetical protein